MALSEFDRNLLERCLARTPRAWEDFVDRFMGLVVHVANHSSQSRSMRLTAQDREDLCAEVFLAIIKDDFAILRRFRGQSSLATYLTVIARRVTVRELLRRKSAAQLAPSVVGGSGVVGSGTPNGEDSQASEPDAQQLAMDRDEVERLLRELEGDEARIVRLYHLDGKSYQEISSTVGIAENSIGPTLSRAREKMRRSSQERQSS